MSQINFEQTKSSLTTSGNCPLCGKFFKGLKLHFNNCFQSNYRDIHKKIDKVCIAKGNFFYLILEK